MEIFQNAVDIFLAMPALNKNDRYIKKPHTAIFTGQTGCGKTHLVLKLIEKEYNEHFDFIVIICQTLWENCTYHGKEWLKTDDNAWLVDPKDNLYQKLLRFLEVLFIIDDIIAKKDLDKRRQLLLDLSIPGQHWRNYLWLLHNPIKAYQRRWGSRPRLFLFGIQRQG